MIFLAMSLQLLVYIVVSEGSLVVVVVVAVSTNMTIAVVGLLLGADTILSPWAFSVVLLIQSTNLLTSA